MFLARSTKPRFLPSDLAPVICPTAFLPALYSADTVYDDALGNLVSVDTFPIGKTKVTINNICSGDGSSAKVNLRVAQNDAKGIPLTGKRYGLSPSIALPIFIHLTSEKHGDLRILGTPRTCGGLGRILGNSYALQRPNQCFITENSEVFTFTEKL